MVIIYEYKNVENIFAKINVPNWSEEVFFVKKVENTLPWAYPISELNSEEVVGILAKS